MCLAHSLRPSGVATQLFSVPRGVHLQSFLYAVQELKVYRLSRRYTFIVVFIRLFTFIHLIQKYSEDIL